MEAALKKIPFPWSETCGEEKIVVVRTRELSYRRKPETLKLAGRIYRKYPNFVKSLEAVNENYNCMVELLEKKAAADEIFMIAPSEPVTVSRFDGDMEKLGALYWLGYHDMEGYIERLDRYLGKAE